MNWLHWNPAIGWAVAVAAGWAFLVLVARVLERRGAAWPAERKDNGIRVGAPKVYDNRSLSLMLEQLEAQLKTMQSIDANAVKAATGTQQGEERSELTAGIAAALSKMAQAAGGGKKKPEEVAADKATASLPKEQPAIPDVASPLKTSARAVDLLNDQVGLSYEIFNLRLLLERALSDRLLGRETRLQAVIGVPISLDPPPYATGCAATVELKIERPASLVALFPQQETFNTWGVDRRRFQLGGSAQTGPNAAGTLSLGKGRQSAFLRRHADVVAMERESETDELIVAWQFRPGPGSRTVAAGLRQMLMVIALPDADTGQDPIQIEAFVRSSWQKWSGDSETASRGAGWRAIWSDRPTHHDWGPHRPFEVPRTEAVEETLKPCVDSIEWARVGSKRAAIIVRGENFFTGTTMMLGDQIVGADNGLTIKSERSLQVLAPLESLVYDAVLNGRYGASMRLTKSPGPEVPPLHIVAASIEPSPSAESSMLALMLATRGTPPPKLNWQAFSKFPDPILSVNGRVVPEPMVFEPSGESGVRASLNVKSEFLPSSSALLVLTWPFYGEDWSLVYQTRDPEIRVVTSRFAAGTERVALLFSGASFDENTTVILDERYAITAHGPLRKLANDLLRLELSSARVNAHRECYICPPEGASVRVVLPEAERSAEPTLDSSKKPPTITANSSASIELAGTGLDTVTAVKLNGASVSFLPYASGTALSLLIEAASVPARGTGEIRLETRSGKKLSAPILIT